MINSEDENIGGSGRVEKGTPSTKVVIELPTGAANRLLELFKQSQEEGKPFTLGEFKIDSVAPSASSQETKT